MLQGMAATDMHGYTAISLDIAEGYKVYILFYGVLWASVETAVCDIYRNVESLQWVITMLA